MTTAAFIHTFAKIAVIFTIRCDDVWENGDTVLEHFVVQWGPCRPSALGW